MKSVASFADVHTKQLLTYLRLLECRMGLILNFVAPLLKDGIRRLIHDP